MEKSNSERAPGDRPSLFQIVVVYTAAGPPIGATYLFLGVTIFGIVTMGMPRGDGVALWIFALLFSYYFGGMYAFLTAVGVALWARFSHGITLAAALIVPCIMLVPGVMGIVTPSGLSGSSWNFTGMEVIRSGDFRSLLMLLVAGLASSVTCRWIITRTQGCEWPDPPAFGR